MAEPTAKSTASESVTARQHTLGDTNYEIRKADFTDPNVLSLLRTHHATVTAPSVNVAGEQTYALDISALQKPNIHLWTIWSPNSTSHGSGSETIIGCAALKILDNAAGEIKSMHTTAAARGQGIGGLMVDKIVEEARRLGLRVLYLETGSMKGFAAVRRFYRAKGFEDCGPFGDYGWQENSVFMCRDIN